MKCRARGPALRGNEGERRDQTGLPNPQLHLSRRTPVRIVPHHYAASRRGRRKTVTALDIISAGRAQLGIGAGWFELEHNSLGYEFGTFTDRFERLEEALQIILPMLRGERVTLNGKWYTVNDVVNSPAPLGHIPVMIGGGGERKTLRLVAQYADESNLIAAPADLARKLDALAGHCQRLGRDRSEITVSLQLSACIAPTHEQAVAEADAYFAARGSEIEALRRPATLIGTGDEIAERCAQLLATGIDGFTINLPANGHIEGRVGLLGQALAPLVLHG
jgi:alkanesulfonate monooxygenase SsuD/methylene tetrahydromethanopterin reductase-like flavin-dependent oxidoreductase (luciferase family)